MDDDCTENQGWADTKYKETRGPIDTRCTKNSVWIDIKGGYS